MASTPSSGGNTIYYQLVIDAQAAIAQIKALEQAGLSFNGTVGAMQTKMQELAAAYGVDISVIQALFERFISTLNLTKEQMDALANQTALKQAGKDLTDANFAGISFASTLRMIEGVIVSMVVFQVIQAISQAFSDANKNAMDYYQSLQNITVAQTAMAQQGMNVTNQQMLDLVNQIHEQWKTISQVDITQAVANAGLMASEFGLNRDQMSQLVQEAAILYQLDPSKPMGEYVTLLGRGLEDGRSMAMVQGQIAISADQTLAKAKELGLVSQDAKSVTDSHIKAVANLAIEFERLNPEAAKLTQEIQNGSSPLVQSEEATAKWKDETTALGASWSHFTATLQQIGADILGILMDFERWIQPIQVSAVLLASNVFNPLKEIAAVSLAIQQIWEGNVHSIHDFAQAVEDAFAKLNDQYAQLAEQNKMLDYRNLSKSVAPQSGIDFSNTPPGTTQDITGANTIDESKLQSILDSVSKDYYNYYNDVEKATEEFNNRMQDLQDRYNLQVQTEEQNFNLRMSQEKANYRLKELQQEQDFRQKMIELQDQYMMDLEDGLRKQDAEAVIKTIEKYNNQKTIDEQQNALKLRQDKQSEELRLQQMKQDEQLRLQQMAAEYKLQQEEAQRAYDQQLANLKQSLDQKLQEEAVKAQQDLNLNQNSINSIYSLFQEYYGSNGKFAQEQQSSYTQMIQQSQGFVDQMGAIYQQYQQILAAMSGGYVGNVPGTYTPGGIGEGGIGGYGSPTPPASPPPPKKYAAGGLALAQAATDVRFGEAGPELAMFLPLNSAGSASAGAAAGALGGLGLGAGGHVTIALQMSPDLEARIVNTTLTHAALSIQKVYGASI